MNPILLNLLLMAGASIIGYLIGSIPWGVVIGKVFYGKDPRDYGSHNSGGTNCGRVLGKRAGYSVILLDIFKTVIAFWIVWGLIIPTNLFGYGLSDLWLNSLGCPGALIPWCAVFFSIIGHCWSIFLKGFKGGKAVSCFGGSVVATSWFEFVIGVTFFLTAFFSKRIMSIASIATAIFVTIFQWTMAILLQIYGGTGFMAILTWGFGFYNAGYFFGWWTAIATTFMAIILIVRHSQNIKRLKAGEEKPLVWDKK